MADSESTIAHFGYRARPLPCDADLLREARRLLRYESNGGGLYWIAAKRPCFRNKIGQLAGSSSGRGYLTVSLLGHKFGVHRIVWLMHHGSLPLSMLDHMNGDRIDNRIENLRLVTVAQNVWNRVRAGNELGTGVADNGHGRYVARLQLPEGAKAYLGTYDTAIEAAAAYVGASVIAHGEFAAFARRPLAGQPAKKFPTPRARKTAR